MNTQLQTTLFKRYPRLFREPGKRLVMAEMFPDFRDRLVDDTAPFDKWGIECGDGWFALVDRLSHACESEIELLRIQGVAVESWPRIGQIKEKMGGLRFYVNGRVSDELRALIFKAENESLRTCEICGGSGKQDQGRWVRTICDSCRAHELCGHLVGV